MSGSSMLLVSRSAGCYLNLMSRSRASSAALDVATPSLASRSSAGRYLHLFLLLQIWQPDRIQQHQPQVYVTNTSSSGANRGSPQIQNPHRHELGFHHLAGAGSGHGVLLPTGPLAVPPPSLG